MAKPIPQMKRPSIPLDVANRFINAGPAASSSHAPTPLSVVPSSPEVTEPPPVAVDAPSTLAASTTGTSALQAPPAEADPLDNVTESLSPATETTAAAPSKAIPAAPRSRSAGGRRLTKRADGDEVRKVTVYLPPELDLALSMHCAASGLERSSVVVNALRRVLK